MYALRSTLVCAVVALLGLVAALDTTLGLGPAASGVGVACGALVYVVVARSLVAAGVGVVGPADLVTLSRATLACGLAGVVAAVVTGASPSSEASRALLVALAVVALLLDAADGRVARRTGTCSPFGARFDGETDAFLLMVLSVYVAQTVGGWVLAIGAARYVFWLGGRLLPWLRGALPPRYWRKVVTAVQGVALTCAAAEVAPAEVATAGLAVALALLTESFGRDVLWLWWHRPPVGGERPVTAAPGGAVVLGRRG